MDPKSRPSALAACPLAASSGRQTWRPACAVSTPLMTTASPSSTAPISTAWAGPAEAAAETLGRMIDEGLIGGNGPDQSACVEHGCWAVSRFNHGPGRASRHGRSDRARRGEHRGALETGNGSRTIAPAHNGIGRRRLTGWRARIARQAVAPCTGVTWLPACTTSNGAIGFCDDRAGKAKLCITAARRAVEYSAGIRNTPYCRPSSPLR